jgi:hypothetical protein
VIFEKDSCSSAAVEDIFRGTEVSVPAPCQDREVPPRAISIDVIVSSTVSIDFTTISTNLVVSHDEEGVVLPRS